MNSFPTLFKKIILSVCVVVLATCSFATLVRASASNGTINPAHYIAKFLDEGSRINFGYFSPSSPYNVHVTNTELTGYLWGENVGWISLNCSNTNSCNSSSFKVSNNGFGNLSGYAWGETTGWVNFKSTTGNAMHKVDLVASSDPTYVSKFSGYSWSENYGWIQFDCAVANACVETDWQHQSTGGPSNPPSNPLNPVTPTVPIVPPVTPPVIPPTNPISPVTPTTPTSPTTPSTPTIPGQPTATPPGTVPPTTPPGISTPPPSSLIPGSISTITGPTFWPGIVSVFKTPAGETVAKIITAVGIVTAAVASVTAALFVNPLSFSELFLIPLRLWSLLLVAFGLKKRNRPWGTVYDSVTKQPLDPAYVVLQDEQGHDVATSITDLDGRYAFLVKPGTYTIVANKTNYTFPSKNLAGKESDEIYSDLYFGERITIETEETVIKKNIPLDPVNFDWNEFAKKDRGLLRFYSKNDIAAARLANVLFAIGFVVAAIALLSAPKPYNIAIFCLYILLFVLKQTGLKPPALGAVLERGTGYPLSFAVVRIYSATTNTEVGKRVADQRGRYHCLVAQGTYYVTVEKKNTDQTYTKVFTSEPFESKNGIINRSFEV